MMDRSKIEKGNADLCSLNKFFFEKALWSLRFCAKIVDFLGRVLYIWSMLA